MSRRIPILTSERVRRTINRLAYEVIEYNRGAANLVILGVRSGGIAIAETLSADIEACVHAAPMLGFLDVTPFRDDRDRSVPPAAPDETLPDISDRDVVLVDDVLFTGRTVRAALDAVVRLGRPRSIQLLVLVDRGHREYPIQPDFVGRVIKTKHKEQVVVDVDNALAVYVEE